MCRVQVAVQKEGDGYAHLFFDGTSQKSDLGHL
jgi:hypothetical protein